MFRKIFSWINLIASLGAVFYGTSYLVVGTQSNCLGTVIGGVFMILLSFAIFPMFSVNTKAIVKEKI